MKNISVILFAIWIHNIVLTKRHIIKKMNIIAEIDTNVTFIEAQNMHLDQYSFKNWFSLSKFVWFPILYLFPEKLPLGTQREETNIKYKGKYYIPL